MIKISRDYLKFLDIVNNSVNKNKKIIFLHSEYGLRDNLRSMYEFLTHNEEFKDYKIICSVNNVFKYKRMKHPKNVKFVDNFIGFYYYLQAKYCFYCYDFYRVKPANEQIVVNLSHGMPFKKQGNLLDGIKHTEDDYFTHLVVSSNHFKNIMKSIYNCEERKLLVSGQPRTDELFYSKSYYTPSEYHKDEREKAAIGALLNNIRYRYMFLWVPTYRDYDDEGMLPLITREGMYKLNEELKDSAAVLLVVIHPLSDVERKFYEGYSNIFIRYQHEIDNFDISLSALMKYSEALITDYASICFDYLLLNKPMAFVIDDLEIYRYRRGFVMDDPLEYMPGKKIKKQDDFSEFIFSCMSGADTFSYDRNELNEQVNEYKDGKSCERICRMIKLI